jgi:hypothetical protein
VVRRIVLPSARRPSTTSHVRRRAAGSKPGRGLVEEDQLRVADERERDVEAPALATRQPVRALPLASLEPDEAEHVIEVARGGVVAGVEAQALADGEVEFRRGLLQHDAEAVAPVAATVKSHVNHLFAKAGLRDRAQAVAYAYRTGIAAL